MTPADYYARHRLARHAWKAGYFAGLSAAERLGSMGVEERMAECWAWQPFAAWAAGEGLARETPPAECRWRGMAHDDLVELAGWRLAYLAGTEPCRPTLLRWKAWLENARQAMAYARDEGKDLP